MGAGRLQAAKLIHYSRGHITILDRPGLEALVRELWIGDHGQVSGLGYLRPDGKMERLRCDVVLLACNGFGGNRELVRELLPEMAAATFAGLLSGQSPMSNGSNW